MTFIFVMIMFNDLFPNWSDMIHLKNNNNNSSQSNNYKA